MVTSLSQCVYTGAGIPFVDFLDYSEKKKTTTFESDLQWEEIQGIVMFFIDSKLICKILHNSYKKLKTVQYPLYINIFNTVHQ